MFDYNAPDGANLLPGHPAYEPDDDRVKSEPARERQADDAHGPTWQPLADGDVNTALKIVVRATEWLPSGQEDQGDESGALTVIGKSSTNAATTTSTSQIDGRVTPRHPSTAAGAGTPAATPPAGHVHATHT